MKEIILFKVSVTTPRIKSLGVKEFGGYKPEGFGGYKPDGGTVLTRPNV